MKPSFFFALIPIALLTGCSSQPATQASPSARLTPQQTIQSIQNDPKVPEGLKQIQINTLQHQPGMQPAGQNSANPRSTSSLPNGG